MTVETTDEMARTVRSALPKANALIMAAAPADYRSVSPSESKIKRTGAALTVEFAPTPDILVETRDARRPGAVVVGFALETGGALASGRRKLVAKTLDLVVVNDARDEGAGFGVDTNRVTLLWPDGRVEPLPLMPKTELADVLLDRVGALLNAG